MNTLTRFYRKSDGPTEIINSVAATENLPLSWVKEILFNWENVDTNDEPTYPCTNAADRARFGLFFVEIGSSDFGTRHEQFFLDPFGSGYVL